MNDLRALLTAFDASTGEGERCALATIVSVEGSSYRRVGARMLVGERGTTAGNISAGCLEGDVIEQAIRVVETRRPAILEYETASTDQEIAWGLGIGCGGSIRVLIEPLWPESAVISALRLACDERRNPFGLRLTTRYDAESVAHQMELFGKDTGLTDPLHRVACDASDGVLVETLLPPTPLVVFGAGPDVLPLIHLARRLGWRTEVVDPQARGASQLHFDVADRVTLARPESAGSQVAISPQTMAVLMTHDYSSDVALLRFLLAKPARYIGVMGPAQRTQRMLRELNVSDAASLARVHAPAGLDIGAEGPEEIALSIVAEMRAVLEGRTGGMLRDRRGAIHGQPASECATTTSVP